MLGLKKWILFFGTLFLSMLVSGAVAYATTPSIHSDYTSNTDACADCHTEIHDSPGAYLLNWDSTSTEGFTKVCMSCHDGTVADAYNVQNGTFVASDSGQIMPCSGGLFALVNDSQSGSGSQHNVFSGLKDNSAYGGSQGGSDINGQWGGSFDCVSCHAPHGEGGNARLLQPNPNWVQTQGQDPETHAGKTNVLMGITNSQQVYDWPADNKDKPMLFDPYSQTTKVYAILNGQDVADGTITYDQGFKLSFATVPPSGAEIRADYTPVLQVNMAVTNKLTSAETIQYISGINNFCGACHTDYNTAHSTTNSASVPNGTYSLHTRHAIGIIWPDRPTAEQRGLTFEGTDPNVGKITCLTCHFAHGVDQSHTWQEQAQRTGITLYNSPELAGSSDLKRLPNMGVCEACHEKGLESYYNEFY